MAPSAVPDVSKPNGIVHATKGEAKRFLLHGPLKKPRRLITWQSGNLQRLNDGLTFFDASGGAAYASVGYGVERVTKDMKAQIDSVSCSNGIHFGVDVVEALKEELVNSTDGKLTGVFICSSGSEASDASMKLAIQYQTAIGQGQRYKFIARRQSYHGATLGALSLSGHKARRSLYEATKMRSEGTLLHNVSHVSPCNTYRGLEPNETEEEYVQRLAEELRKEFREVGKDKVAAFVAEPVVGAALGCVPSVRGYLKEMKKVCTDFGALMIVDEVMCGMGRLGTNLHAWQKEEGFVPDIQTIGKGLGGGYSPIAAVLASPAVTEAIVDDGELAHGQTYQGHAVPCSAALAVLKVIRDDDLLHNAQKMGLRLEAGLRKNLGNHRYVGNIRGDGLFWGIEFVRDRTTKKPFERDQNIAKELNAKGLTPDYEIYIYYGTGSYGDGVRGDHLLIAPALNINKEGVDTVIDKTTKLINDFFNELDKKLDNA